MLGSHLVKPSHRTGFSHWRSDAVALRLPMEPRAQNWARAQIHYRPERPAVCSGLQPSLEMCGSSRAEATLWLTRLEAATAPCVQPVAAEAATGAGSATRGWRASHQRSKK